MSLKYFFLVFMIISILFLPFGCESSFKQKIAPNNKSTIKPKAQLEENAEKFQKRKLDTNTGYYDGTDPIYSFARLSIYLDLAEYYYTLPTRIIQYNETLILAMNRAKELLESLFEIAVKKDYKPTFTDFDTDYCFSTLHLTANYKEGLDLNKNNFFIIVKFIDPDKLFLEWFTQVIFPSEYDSFIFMKREQVDNSLIPLIGIVYLSDKIEEYKLKSLDYLTNLFIKNFIKLLGFHYSKNGNLFENRANPYFKVNTTIESLNPFFDGYYCKFNYEFYSFPKTKSYLKKYYNIQDDLDYEIELFTVSSMWNWNLTGEELSCEVEHIELLKERFLGEILNSPDYPEEQVLSGLILNFLDDLYYLNLVNHEFPDLMKFGKNKGIIFLKGKISEKYGGLENDRYINPRFPVVDLDEANKKYLSNNESFFKSFDNEFYLPRNFSYFDAEKPSCSSARLTKTKYKLNQVINTNAFKRWNSPYCYSVNQIIYEHDGINYYFFTYENYTGRQPNIFCPIPLHFEEPISTNIYSGHCSEINFTEKDEDRYETLSDHSFCVISSLVDKANIADKSYKSLCYEMFCSALSLTIKIGEYYIVCPREGGQIKAKYFTGYLLCPDYNLICSNTILCNSNYNCFEKNSKIKATAFDYDYEIKTTQDPSVYEVPNPEISIAWEKADDGICVLHCSQCKDRNTCVQCRPNYFLVEDSDGNRQCLEDSKKTNAYYRFDREEEIYKKCDIDTPHCLECSYDYTSTNPMFRCTKCEAGFINIPDYNVNCGELSSKLYFPLSDGDYIPCLNYGNYPNCLKCEDQDGFTCLECNENYVFYYSNSQSQCINKNSVDETMFKNSTGNIYYSCNKYNDIENCAKCDNEEECKECLNGYNLVFIDEKYYCFLNGNINNEYYLDSEKNIYYKCSYNLDNCFKCSDKTNCIECNNNYLLEEDNTCIDKNLFIQNLYYLDSTTQKYFSCQKISNCQKCLSATECIVCTTHYFLVEDGNSIISCQNVDTTEYFSNTIGGKTIYKKCSNYYDNCAQCSATECTSCKTNYYFVEDNNDISCKSINTNEYFSTIINGKSIYKKCSNYDDNCAQCSATECSSCKTNYYFVEDNNDISCQNIDTTEYFPTTIDGKTIYKKCSNHHENCAQCSATECSSCKTNYFLVEGESNDISCQNVDTTEYFPTTIDGKIIYKKCSNYISNCEQCSSVNYCTKCENNNAIIDNDHTKCENILAEKYYYDSELGIYTLCSNKMSNCEFCSTNGIFICKKCFENYAFKRENENNIECVEKTDVDGLNTFYTNDTGNNYYSCNFYNKVKNCKECSNGESCEKCMEPNTFFYDNKLCALQADVENNLYTRNGNGLIDLCSNLIKDCDRCHNDKTCYKCQDEAELLENDTCILKEIIEQEQNFFKDETTNKYISCSIMEHCLSCKSGTECIKCEEGFNLNNNKCSDDEENKGLSKGAVSGIVIGVVLFLLLLGLIAYFVYKKMSKKYKTLSCVTDSNNRYDINEIKKEKEENKNIHSDDNMRNNVVVHKRRSVHNIK